MNSFNNVYKSILHESRISTISTGFYQCTNAENLGHILNVLNRYHGTRTLDGGVIELFYGVTGDNLDAVKILASLLEYGYVRKYSYGDTKHYKTYRTLILSKEQLAKRIPGLEVQDYTTRTRLR